ncbi:MAG: relaxase/mobilization nuclease domain-containing protein, partial [Candidatus Eremiobacteraeota bacterium]|nr:relaxase/mobilization nuclease domain-containing protein [Candidatus Eremiobacteraeota bacterium]
MIVGFSKYGRGRAARALRYLIDRVRDGAERNPAPTVLRGDPALVSELIDSLPFKHRYTCGVLSFAPGERVTPQTEQAIIDRFERVAFAGLEADQYAILWVRHEHAEHHELNFLVPRVELSTGRSLNIAPPGRKSRELYDMFRSRINAEHGFADPDDPARRRDVSIPHHVAKLRAGDLRAGRKAGEDPRELIAKAVAAAVDGGLIQDRRDVIGFLRQAGLQLNRESENFLSVRDPEMDAKYRLKGPHFHANFQRKQPMGALTARQPQL